MAYDASFLTGSHERPVDPISTGYLHNDQEISELENGHTILVMDGNKLNLAIESFDQMSEFGLELHHNVRRGKILSNSMYRILNAELKAASKKTGAAFDPLPAMESLDHIHPRELTIAMENAVTDFIKDMWTKLKNMFLAAHKKIKDWYIKAWDGAARLKKQAEALKAKADSMSSSTPRETSFEMAGVKFLNINGKVPQPQDIGQGVAKINEITQVICGKNPDTYDKIYPAAESMLKLTIEQAKAMKNSDATPPKEGESKPESISEAFGGTSGSTTSDANGNQVTQTGEENKLMNALMLGFNEAAKMAGVKIDAPIKGDTRFPEDKGSAYRNPQDLLGGIMLVYTTPVQTNVTTFDSYAAFKQGFKLSPEPIQATPREIDDNGTFNTAPSAVIINICENVISSCDIFVNYKLLWDKREKATENLMKQMEQYVSANSNLQGVGQKHINNSITTTVALVKKMGDGESRWSKYAMSVLNKAIVYCRTSLNQY